MSLPDWLPRSSSAIDPAPDLCPVCHGTGFEYDPIKRRSRRCVRCRGGSESLLERARIPARYRESSFDNFRVNPDDERQKSLVTAVLACRRYVKDYPVERGLGLLFLGPCGVGKTHLAVATANALMRLKRVPCLFYDFRDLLKAVQETYNPLTQTTELSVLRPVYDVDVLILDELGAGKATEWVRDTITHILNTRYNEQKTTIITSNYLDQPSDRYDETLEERIGVRLRSRLYEMCKTIQMFGEDYRQTYLNKRLLMQS
ncbi:ATP-binding protein [Chloracidobacterium aggregatum]|uniref:ATP-binding protein n=1 Tax=Chloracidobacterium aggregatum TaxID=2851959 RepID=UPI001B8C3CC7|nr:ATP-binding protein [Chloracidobacterium aggregatum]QUV85525.1 ATP-binding protein [Chloracidobacterium sp. 2]QUV88073.1 ATP-binding protein [Chloracidobacterium sp. S]QUV90995.1 ATP-binding protein [Chloracidobacterium sp. A]